MKKDFIDIKPKNFKTFIQEKELDFIIEFDLSILDFRS